MRPTFKFRLTDILFYRSSYNFSNILYFWKSMEAVTAIFHENFIKCAVAASKSLLKHKDFAKSNRDLFKNISVSLNLKVGLNRVNISLENYFFLYHY